MPREMDASMSFFQHERHVESGFTLIETIAILLLVSILSLLAIVSWTNSNAGLVAETDTLKSNIRYAQYKAMSDVTSTLAAPSWGVSLGGSSYTLLSPTSKTGLPGETSSSQPWTHTYASGIKMTATSAAGSIVYFDSRGRPVDITGTLLTSSPTITLSQSSQTMTVTITANTGFVP